MRVASARRMRNSPKRLRCLVLALGALFSVLSSSGCASYYVWKEVVGDAPQDKLAALPLMPLTLAIDLATSPIQLPVWSFLLFGEMRYY